MPKFHIDGRALSEAEIDQVRAALVAAGCDSEDIDVIRTVTKPTEKSDDEVFVCILSPAFLADAQLESILLQAIDGGRRVIAVWPKGSANLATPPAVLKYCYSVVPWDQERLREVLAQDDCICFQTPAGDPLDMPEPERRICP